MSATLASTGTVRDSFWRPSRGPTSNIFMVRGDWFLVFGFGALRFFGNGEGRFGCADAFAGDGFEAFGFVEFGRLFGFAGHQVG